MNNLLYIQITSGANTGPHESDNDEHQPVPQDDDHEHQPVPQDDENEDQPVPQDDENEDQPVPQDIHRTNSQDTHRPSSQDTHRTSSQDTHRTSRQDTHMTSIQDIHNCQKKQNNIQHTPHLLHKSCSIPELKLELLLKGTQRENDCIT